MNNWIKGKDNLQMGKGDFNKIIKAKFYQNLEDFLPCINEIFLFSQTVHINYYFFFFTLRNHVATNTSIKEA